MLSTNLLPLALAALTLLQPATSLGINCRGSGVCPLAGFENDGDEGILQGLRDAMYSVPEATVPGSTLYHDGDHIICVSSSIKISISVGVSAKGVSGKIGLNGKLGIGGVCAFAQSTNGAGITLDRARQLMDGMLDHGCKVCGSNPTQPGNDVKNGELTVNYVKNPSCTGNCLGAGAGLNPTAGKDQTSSAAAAPAPASSSAAAVLASSTSSAAVVLASSTASSAADSPSAVASSLAAIMSALPVYHNATTLSTVTSAAGAAATTDGPSRGGAGGKESYTVIPYIAYTTVALPAKYKPRGIRA